MTNKKKPQTPAQRKASERARNRKTGLVPMHLWVKPEWKNPINDLIDQLKGEEK